MRTCPSCRAPNQDASRFCTACGTSLRAASATSAQTTPVMDGGVFPTPMPGPAGAPSVPRQPSGWSGPMAATGAPTLITGGRMAAEKDRLFTPGQIVAGRYRIVSCLGQGGMGEVYRADDLSLGHPVALKFLPPGFAENPRWMERFRNEVRTARQVAHPNVCRVHDLGEVSGAQGSSLVYLTMEYIDGEDLASLLRRIGRLPRDKAVQVAHQMCSGLAAAHHAGVLHRDLKPANIMIDGRGNAKITDFGIAGIAGSIDGNDVRSGTPAYMAPEQLAGREVSTRSDIYSLGLVLYELFTGRRAFEAESAGAGTRTQEDVSRPSTIVDDMDPAIERVIMRCLQDDPALRPASAMIVAVGLPGGDPLRAALEAGETPSPELVAAAGADERVSRRVTVPLLALCLVMVAGCFLVSRLTGLASFVPLPRSPEVLADRAREVVSTLGPQIKVVDTEADFTLQRGQLAAISRRAEAGRWEPLREGRPAVLRFWLRTSPRALTPIGQQGAVVLHDPAFDVPGMTMVEMDSLGRLVRYQAVPPWPETSPTGAGVEDAGGAGAAPSAPAVDWARAFELAGLKMEHFKAAAPKRVPAHFAEERFSWEPSDPEGAHQGVRVDAAAFEGHATAFQVVSALEPASTGGDASRSAGQYYQYLIQSVIIIGVFFSLWLARVNYRTGRGDRSGAARLASGFFGLAMLLWVLNTHWSADIFTQWPAFVRGSGQWLVVAGLAWVFYMALEPFVRRSQPHLIVSWTRLVSGRVRDPLVGRDALIGFAAGAVFALCWFTLPLVHKAARGYLSMPAMFDPQVLRGVVGAFTAVAGSVMTAAINAMLIFFLFIALDTFIPRRIGAVVFGVLAAGAFVNDAGGGSLWVGIGFGVCVGTVLTLLLARVGLLAFGVSIAVASVLMSAPLTSELGSWHARGVWVCIFSLVALLVWAATSAMGAGVRRPVRVAAAPL